MDVIFRDVPVPPLEFSDGEEACPVSEARAIRRGWYGVLASARQPRPVAHAPEAVSQQSFCCGVLRRSSDCFLFELRRRKSHSAEGGCGVSSGGPGRLLESRG